MPTPSARLRALRDQLVRERLDGFVVPLTDEHMSEYVGSYAQRLEWLTGFKGSAGSAVVLPEVFLKAVAVARNQGHDLTGLTTANLDFLRHYRPQVNVVTRPVAGIGRGISLVGHHELLIPLLVVPETATLNHVLRRFQRELGGRNVHAHSADHDGHIFLVAQTQAEIINTFHCYP